MPVRRPAEPQQFKVQVRFGELGDKPWFISARCGPWPWAMPRSRSTRTPVPKHVESADTYSLVRLEAVVFRPEDHGGVGLRTDHCLDHRPGNFSLRSVLQ